MQNKKIAVSSPRLKTGASTAKNLVRNASIKTRLPTIQF